MKVTPIILKHLRYALAMRESERYCSTKPDGSWDGPPAEGLRVKKAIIELREILKKYEVTKI